MRSHWTRNLLLVIILLVALILQTTILPLLQVKGAMADLLLILIIFSALCTGSIAGGIIGLIIGLIEDLLGGRYLGLCALSAFSVGYLVGYLEGKVYRENIILPLVFVFLGTFIYNGIFFLGQGVTGTFPYALPVIWKSLAPEALYNTILAAILYRPFVRLVIGETPAERVQGYRGELYR